MLVNVLKISIVNIITDYYYLLKLILIIFLKNQFQNRFSLLLVKRCALNTGLTGLVLS